MATRKTTCPLCEALCGLLVDVEGGEVGAIRGDPDDPLSRGHLCPKATALPALHADPDRLRQPVRRDGDRWGEVSWDEALDEAAQRLVDVRKAHGRQAVGAYIGNPTVHNYGSILAYPLFSAALQSHSRFSATSADQLPHMFAALQMFGAQLLMPVPDVDRTDLMVIMGGNPAVSNGSIMTAPGIKRRLRAIRERGGRVVVIDPRRTETARLADRHHFITPGTDALLLAAVARTLFADDLVQLGGAARYVTGVERLQAAVEPFTPDRVAAQTGWAPAEITGLARDLAAAPTSVLYGRLGVCTQRFGGLGVWLVNAINVLTGNFDRPGGLMFARPAADLVTLAGMLGQSGHHDRYRSRVSGLPEFGGELPVTALAEEIDTPGDGQIRALVTLAGNPALSAPNGPRLGEALASLDFMVSIDPWINETTRHADLILPPVSHLERDHYGLVFHALAVRDTAKFHEAVLPRPDGGKEDWEIMLALAERLWAAGGGGTLFERGQAKALRRFGARGSLDAMLTTGPYGALRNPLRGLTLARLARQPNGVDLGPLKPCMPTRLRTPDGRLHLAPEVLLGDIPRLAAALDEPPFEANGVALLIGRRTLRSNNSWLHNAAGMVAGKPRCTLRIAPDHAAALGLGDGDSAHLSSPAGAITVPVEVDPDIMPGVVSLPHGWGHRAKGHPGRVAASTEGASINDVVDGSQVDTLTGTAGLNGVRVTIGPA